MNESLNDLTAVRGGQGKSKELPIKVKLGEQIVEGGGERKVYRITIVLDKKEIPAVLKTMTSEETKQEYENYQICKKYSVTPSVITISSLRP